MVKKRIAIQCPCQYTRKGIEALFRNDKLFEECKVVASISDIDRYENSLIRLPVVDIIIMALSSTVDNPVSTLRLLGEFLPSMHPNAKILLIADVMSSGVMARYLFELNRIWAVLDTANSLDALEYQLVNIVQGSTDSYNVGKIITSALSVRETTVLRRLLDGKTASGIAKSLQISPKTVSSYKRSALIKLKIRSLQPLIINNNSKKLTSDFLYSSILKTSNTRQFYENLYLSQLVVPWEP